MSGQPPALADGDEIATSLLALAVAFRLDDEILQQALGGDARGQRLDMRLRVPGLAGIARRGFELIQRNEFGLAGFGLGAGGHDRSPCWVVVGRHG